MLVVRWACWAESFTRRVSVDGVGAAGFLWRLRRVEVVDVGCSSFRRSRDGDVGVGVGSWVVGLMSPSRSSSSEASE